MTSSPGLSSSNLRLSDTKRALLEQRLRRRTPVRAPAVPRRPPDRPVPLSFGQERLWFMEQFAPGSAAYTIPIPLRLRGPLDADRLELALRAVVARHESLRMRFPADEDGRPYVLIGETPDVELRRTAADEASAADILSAETARPFDLAEGPLIRSTLIRLAEDDHALLITVHHIAADGWSTEILTEELRALYGGADLPDLEVQYGDYALWQRERPVAEQDLAYWRERLAGVPPLELPADGRRPAQQTFAGAAHGFRLDRGLADAVAGFAGEGGATLYMALLAAYQVLLGRHSGQEDFAVGSPVGGRPRRELEGMIGLFVNVLAMRAELGGDPTFRELVARVRRSATEAYAHQELPFERLVGELGVVRDVSRSPVFQVVLTLQSYRNDRQGGWPGLTAEPFDIEARAARFDLELFLEEEPDGINGIFIYNRDMFGAETVASLASQFETLLRAAVAEPDARISELEIVPPGERERILAHAAGPREPCDREATLGTLFEAQAARTPDAVAVEFEDVRLTYAELDARAGRLARRLRGLGVGPGSRVAICAERSPELVAGLLGVLKAGGAYVPLDPDYPAERIAFMLADAEAAVLLVQRTVADRLPPTGAVTVPLDEVGDGARDEARDEPPPGGPPPSAGPSDIAYMIYTSGSTGRPKGVPNTHAAIVNRLDWMQRSHRLSAGDAENAGDAGDVVLQKTPAGFDVSVWEFFWPLVTGARLLLARPGGHRDTAYLRDLIIERGVTTMHFVPSMLAAFLTEEGIERCTSLRRVVCSGEELAPHVAERFFARLPGAELYNLYGPTEAAVDVTQWRCVPGDATVPIGHPVQNTELYVLDRRLRPVPFGVPGELHIGGVQLATGYHARPGLTAERFVPDPFGPPGSRLYKTGDLVRLRRDGAIVFLGRIDTQVKIRGQRIELGEIESVLREQPGVGEAVVTVREDGAPGDRRLAAYVVPAARPGPAAPETAAGPAPDPAGLRTALKALLPDAMVPSAIVVLDALPLSPNGKLDRAALPAPERHGEAGGRGAEPRTPAERAIAGLWRELLGVETVGVDDDFFELGGHSLVAVQAVARLRKVLPGLDGGRAVGVMDLFKHPTVRALAELVERADVPRGPRSLLYELTRPGPRRSITYVCIPYGGGQAMVFQPLADALPEECALYAMAFPGHDPGLPDEETKPLDEIADQCVTEILEGLDGPLAIYGHCGIGGALAVEVARRLEARGRELEAVYIGAIFPFARPTGRIAGPLGRLLRTDRLRGDRAYENRMKSMGNDVSGLDEEQIRFMVRNQRRDTLIAEESFTRLLQEEIAPLRAPVVSVVGEQDPATDYYLERYREWHFLSPVTALVILDEAGHYFLKYRAEDLAEILTNTHIAMGYGAAHTLDRTSRGPAAGWWIEETSVRPPGAPDASGGTAPEAATAPEPPAALAGGNGAPPATRAGGRTAPAARTRERPPRRRDARPAPEPSMRRFMVVALAQLVTMTGTAITDFAIPVWIYLATGSLVDFALFTALSIMPGVVAAPLIGALVDRAGKRRMMAVGGCLAGGTQLVLGALLWTGNLEIWHFYPLTACLSVALIFQRLAFTTALPQLVPKQYLGHAAGLVQMVMGTSQFVAPLAAVALLSSIGLEGILAVDVASFAVLLGVLVLVRFPATMAHVRRETLTAEIAGGFRMSFGNRHLRAALLYFAALNVMLAALLLSISPLVLSFATLSTAGQISFAGGVGATLGGLAVALWGGPRRRRMRGVLLATLLLSFFAVVTGLHASPLVVGAGAFGLWFSLSIVNGVFMTIVHVKVPQRFHGRVMAVNQMISWSTLPLGMAVVAPLGERLLEPLLAPGGALASSVGAVIGVGEGRGIAFMYVILGLGIAVHVLVSMRIPVLARFDDEVPEATPDDLVGAQALRERAGNRVSLAWSAPAFAKALTMPLSPEKASALLGAEVERVVLRTGGEISAVYEVRCADRSLPHPDLIVKLYPDLFTARLRKEMLVYDLLRGSGVPAPSVVKWDESRRDLPHAYLVMTKVEGRPLSEVSGALPEPVIAGLYREMGTALRALHGVELREFGPVDGVREPDNEAYLGGQLDLRTAQFAEFGGDPALHAEIVGYVAARRHLLARCRTPVLCHHDFHERNVMVAEHDGSWHLTGVIDMENALGGDPLMDLAKTDYFAVRGDPVRRRELLAGYGGLPADWAERVALYRLYHALDQWGWLATIGETDTLAPITDEIRACLKDPPKENR
ncbi:non-ribosomal peptide synthetase [Planomonospora venezuelensis]|uniref:Amino acid adenylation domain-containing protein n=1 Tax=Planomonospora venezuelensis TaxID=1999 RepID=A0A841D5R8_PLAVE|nr:amino acid adenylation domain-containing protein [Planomonospora venezuelensis]